MKKKYILLTVISFGITAMLGAAGICYHNHSESKEEKIYTINSKTDRATDYHTISDLASNSEIIVRGSISNTVAICDQDGHIHTKCIFHVSESYNGDFKSGDPIDMLAVGGIMDVKEYSESVDDWLTAPSGVTQVEYTFDGAPLIEDGQEYIIFANSYVYSDGNTYYYPIGNYQGKFEINKDEIERYVPSDFTEEISETNTNDFIEEVIAEN